MEHDRSKDIRDAAGLLRTPVRRWKRGVWERFDDAVSPETLVRLSWPGGEGTLWAWPGDLETLCLGHALLESGNPAPARPRSPAGAGRSVADFVRRLPDNGAGAAPVPTFAVDIPPGGPPLRAAAGRADLPGRLAPQVLLDVMGAFLSPQGPCSGRWDDTGCFHRAALADGAGGIPWPPAEDISRHNCVDRLAGRAFLAGVDPGACALLLSARVTASLYDRARRAGFRCMISRSAVTTAAIRRAEAEGVALVGFCRPAEKRFTVFADPRGWLAP